MGNTAITTAFVLVCFVGCGARTGLEAGDNGDDTGIFPTVPDGSTTRPPGATASYPLCAFHAGPIRSCDAGPPPDEIQNCDSTFPYCVDVGGDWGCCTGAGPYNGPGGDCRFTEGPTGPPSYACR